MTVAFKDNGHLYYSPDQPERKWTSITAIVGMLHEPFKREDTAWKCALRKPTDKYPNKWWGMTQEQILAAWDGEGKRSQELGNWYHNKRERELCEPDMQLMWGVRPPIVEDGIKISRDQKLEDGIYPEHLVYLDTAGICGQSDYVEVKEHSLRIRDYKTSKEIKRKGFESSWSGEKMMTGPVKHLGDCEYWHYALQLSLYAYCIQRHNPRLTHVDLAVEHIKFELEGEDKFGYPIVLRHINGDPVVKEIELVQLPYLLKEVKAVLEWLKTKQKD